MTPENTFTPQPRLLDLFCGAGGAAMGYRRAGFRIVGVDIRPQPNYPFEFYQDDAINVLKELVEDGGGRFTLDGTGVGGMRKGFDAVHASPPCQAYSALAAMHPRREHPQLIEVVRDLLTRSKLPWVIENVEGAPLLREPGLYGSHGLVLCGSSFGLGARGRQLRRHRLFESSHPFVRPACRHHGPAIGVYGHGGHSKKHRMANAAEAREALAIDWMTRDEMAQAIPPAYTEYLGAQLLQAIGEGSVKAGQSNSPLPRETA